MDSISLAFWIKPDIAITINYGQLPAKAEIQASKMICKFLKIRHIVLDVDCSSLGSGDLSRNPKVHELAPVSEWWPYRNQLLVTLCAMKAIQFNVKTIYIGSVSNDDIHADGTKEFYKKFAKVIGMQEGNISLETPVINFSTVELIKKSKIPLSYLLLAHSCHKSNIPCMNCNGCDKYLFTLQNLGFD